MERPSLECDGQFAEEHGHIPFLICIGVRKPLTASRACGPSRGLATYFHALAVIMLDSSHSALREEGQRRELAPQKWSKTWGPSGVGLPPQRQQLTPPERNYSRAVSGHVAVPEAVQSNQSLTLRLSENGDVITLPDDTRWFDLGILRTIRSFIVKCSDIILAGIPLSFVMLLGMFRTWIGRLLLDGRLR